MVRVKLVLDLGYVGAKYVGWQPQPKPRPVDASVSGFAAASNVDDVDDAATIGKTVRETTNGKPSSGLQQKVAPDVATVAGPSLMVPCKAFNKGKCRHRDGCNFAHICSTCFRTGRLQQISHAACERACPVDPDDAQSVQEVVEGALRRSFTSCEGLRSLFAKPPSGLVSSGRTDRGVHAQQMVAYCNCHTHGQPDDKSMDVAVSSLSAALQQHLPPDIRCHGVTWTKDISFCPRGNARKTYVYYLVESCPSPAVLGRLAEFVWIIDGPLLDLECMREALSSIVGRHDFAGLSNAPTNAHDTVREVLSADLEPLDHWRCDMLDLCFHMLGVVQSAECPLCQTLQRSTRTSSGSTGQANNGIRLTAVRISGLGFLKHMVRCIVGQLVAIGRGDASPRSMADCLQSRPAIVASPCQEPMPKAARIDTEVKRAPKAPACGLWLDSVETELDGVKARC